MRRSGSLKLSTYWYSANQNRYQPLSCGLIHSLIQKSRISLSPSSHESNCFHTTQRTAAVLRRPSRNVRRLALAFLYILCMWWKTQQFLQRKKLNCSPPPSYSASTLLHLVSRFCTERKFSHKTVSLFNFQCPLIQYILSKNTIQLYSCYGSLFSSAIIPFSPSSLWI